MSDTGKKLIVFERERYIKKYKIEDYNFMYEPKLNP